MSEATESVQIQQSSRPAIEVDELKTYYEEGGFRSNPVKAVDGVSFSIQKGETLGLVGESGCGKTTLGRTLVQLESSTAGEIHFDGENITEFNNKEIKEWRKKAQIVFQDPDSSLNDRLTIGEIIREPLDVHNWPEFSVHVNGVDQANIRGDVQSGTTTSSRDVDIEIRVVDGTPTVSVRDNIPIDSTDVDVDVTDDDGRTNINITIEKSKSQIRQTHVRNLLAAVGLREEHYYRYPHQFSGGQRQRIGIARALALEPEFVVLDEPVSALDVSVQAKILNLLDDLQDEFDLTYLFIAHDLSVVRHICDRVAVMYLGNIMELGETEELFTNPANPYTQSLLSAIPEPNPKQGKERLTLRGAPPSPRNPPSGCPFSTRCPAKIRPSEYRQLDAELWESIELLADIIRERKHSDKSIRETIKGMLGIESQFSDVDDIFIELFSETEAASIESKEVQASKAEDVVSALPADVQPPLREIVSHLRESKTDKALEVFLDEFGSECDSNEPELHAVSDSGRESFCHRHQPKYASTEKALETLPDS